MQVVAAEPLPGDPVMGLRSLEDGYVPPVLHVVELDRKLLVSNDEAAAAARALLDREGIFAGVSSGAVVHVARRVAEELPEGAVVVCVLADGGWKYLSAPFWAGRRDRRGRALVVIPPDDPRGAPRARRRGGAERVLRARARLPDDVAVGYIRGGNKLASPYRYELYDRPGRLVGDRRGATSRWSSIRTPRPSPARRAPTASWQVSGAGRPFLIYGLARDELARLADRARRGRGVAIELSGLRLTRQTGASRLRR